VNKNYKCLSKQLFSNEEYSILPIRKEDRYDIMKWRNEQIYHLRQDKLLTKEDQDKYFNDVVSVLFEKEQPNQILFSYLKDDKCIGYGGLVHINWLDKNAEISFVMETKLENEYFEFHWSNFLGLIENVAFEEIRLHKIYTYAFDLRPKLYKSLNNKNFEKEALLKDHCFFENEFIDVIIHSKINKFKYRTALINDIEILFKWANEEGVRNNALNKSPIKWEQHVKWFNEKLLNRNTVIWIFLLNNIPIGQIRLDYTENEWVIDYSVDKYFRGKGFGSKMISEIINKNKYIPLVGIVKKENVASRRIFEKLKFIKVENNTSEGNILNKYKFQ
jgi:RimJ/RimL family protein N-acetyltransferase